jgi:hypothetical protein
LSQDYFITPQHPAFFNIQEQNTRGHIEHRRNTTLPAGDCNSHSLHTSKMLAILHFKDIFGQAGF